MKYVFTIISWFLFSSFKVQLLALSKEGDSEIYISQDVDQCGLKFWEMLAHVDQFTSS